MRHRVAGRRLSRTSEHRLAMRRNMVSSLFEHETISTTLQKAKEVRPFAEKLITLAKKGSLHNRRRAISLLGNRALMVEEDGDMVKQGTVVGKLFSEIGPRYLDRAGGYTRIIRLPKRRLGDNGEVVLLQLVGQDDQRGKKTKARKTVHAGPVAPKEAQTSEPKDEVEAQEVETDEPETVQQENSEDKE